MTLQQAKQALARPLRFGDDEQIRALALLEKFEKLKDRVREDLSDPILVDRFARRMLEDRDFLEAWGWN